MLDEFVENISDSLRGNRYAKWMLALIGLSGVVILLTLAAPYIGLGTAEEFVLYKLFAISRGMTIGFLTGFVILLLAIVLVVAVDRMNRDRHGADYFIRTFNKTQRLAAAWWWQVNRPWVVACVLVLPAIYVFLFYWMAFPDGVWLAPDSDGYVTFSERRTLFYPALIRLLALLSDNPGLIAGFQVAFGLIAIIFLCEAIHRLIRNCCVGILLGLLLMFNWPLFEHSMFMLTDYPAVANLCVVLGVFALSLERPSSARLLFLAISIGTAIALRPVGVILLVILPFVVLVHPHSWKRMIGFVAVPLLAIVLMLVGVQKMVHGSYALSPSTGYSMGNNTAFLLMPETPVRYPELRENILKLVEPLLVQEKKQDTWREIIQFRFDTLNQTIGQVGLMTREFGEQKGIVTQTDLQPKIELLEALGKTSALNRGFSAWDRLDEPYWVWLDRTLADMARNAVRHNPEKVIQDMIPKLLFSWENVIPVWKMPEKEIGPLTVMNRPVDDKSLLETKRYTLGNGEIISASGFNAVGGMVLFVASKIPLKYIFLTSSLIIGIGALVQLIVYRRLTPAVAVLAACVGLTVCYHFAISMGQMPLFRFITGILPASGLIVVSILCLWQKALWIVRRPDRLEKA